MKHLSSILVFALLCVSSVAFAESSDTKAQQNLFELQPIYTLNARNVQRATFNLTYDNFKNVRLEEADEFDGYTTTAELIIPFGKTNSWEIRLLYPFHTEGDARFIAGDQDIKIKGNSGVFDYANVVVQRELSTADKCPVNSSVYVGYGHRTEYLKTNIDDVYNHTGDMFRFGFNLDNAKADRNLRLQATVDVRHYYDSDDINPSDDGVVFDIVNVSGGAVYNTDFFVKPAFEVLYSTDFGDRLIVQAVPEVIVPLGDKVEIKAGYAIGDSKGEGTTQTGTLRTTFKF